MEHGQLSFGTFGCGFWARFLAERFGFGFFGFFFVISFVYYLSLFHVFFGMGEWGFGTVWIFISFWFVFFLILRLVKGRVFGILLGDFGGFLVFLSLFFLGGFDLFFWFFYFIICMGFVGVRAGNKGRSFDIFGNFCFFLFGGFFWSFWGVLLGGYWKGFIEIIFLRL